MSMLFGFLCLIGAIVLFLSCLPKAVKNSNMYRTTRLKKPVSTNCKH